MLFPPFAQGARLGFQSEDRIYASAEYLFSALVELEDNERIKIIAPKYIEMQRGSIEREERLMNEEFRDHYLGRSARISSRLRFAERLSKAGLKDEASTVLAEARLIAVGSAADRMLDIDEMAERYQIQ